MDGRTTISTPASPDTGNSDWQAETAELERLLASKRASLPAYEPAKRMEPKVPKGPSPEDRAAAAERRAWLADKPRREQAAKRKEAKTSFEKVLATLGPRYDNATIENWIAETEHQRKAKQLVQNYLDHIGTAVSGGMNLLLLGTVGTGKTHLATGVLRQAAQENHIDVGVLTVADWLARFPETWTRNPEAVTDEALMRQGTEPKLLLLEDPNPEKGSIKEWQLDPLWRLIDHRYRFMQPVIITANLSSREEAVKVLGHRVWDRLRHGATIAFLDGDSHREPNCTKG